MSVHYQATPERSHQAPRKVAPFNVTPNDVRRYADLTAIGINLDDRTLGRMIQGLGLDSVDGPAPVGLQTQASITTPVQFLQAWLPGFVRVLTAARKIDTLVGLTTAGSWEDHSVVQGIMEQVGEADIYSDYDNLALASWNTNFAEREIVRGEMGMQVGLLEEARAARIRVNSAAEKRTSAALSLDIFRNRVGFYGFNAGSNRTYGFLNDPELLPYETFPAVGTGSSTQWKDKNFQQITADLRLMAQMLRTQGQGNIDPAQGDVTLALPVNCADYLSVATDLGYSVRQWIKETYPNWRIETAVELQEAHGGENVVYLYAEHVEDGASDDSRTFVQVVPAKFQTLGVEKRVKSYLEGYTNATAGLMTKRPFAVTRWAGC